MKPAHAHKDGKRKTGLNESPIIERFRKLMCVRVQGGRKRDKTRSRVGVEVK
jgi:hypothetical protein